MAAQTILFQKNIEQVTFYKFLCLLDGVFNLCLSKKTRSEDSESIGRWATYIKKRIEVDELRREFNGWSGNHERHCVLHDVFTM